MPFRLRRDRMFEISPIVMSVKRVSNRGRVRHTSSWLTLRGIESKAVHPKAEEIVSVLRQPATNVLGFRSETKYEERVSNPQNMYIKASRCLLRQASKLACPNLRPIVPVADPVPTGMEVLILVDSRIVVLRERRSGGARA